MHVWACDQKGVLARGGGERRGSWCEGKALLPPSAIKRSEFGHRDWGFFCIKKKLGGGVASSQKRSKEGGKKNVILSRCQVFLSDWMRAEPPGKGG